MHSPAEEEEEDGRKGGRSGARAWPAKNAAFAFFLPRYKIKQGFTNRYLIELLFYPSCILLVKICIVCLHVLKINFVTGIIPTKWYIPAKN